MNEQETKNWAQTSVYRSRSTLLPLSPCTAEGGGGCMSDVRVVYQWVHPPELIFSRAEGGWGLDLYKPKSAQRLRFFCLALLIYLHLSFVTLSCNPYSGDTLNPATRHGRVRYFNTSACTPEQEGTLVRYCYWLALVLNEQGNGKCSFLCMNLHLNPSMDNSLQPLRYLNLKI